MRYIVPQIVLAAIVLYPLWIIFKRAGLNPYWSLLAFVPFAGLVAAGIALSTMQWNPTTSRENGGDL